MRHWRLGIRQPEAASAIRLVGGHLGKTRQIQTAEPMMLAKGSLAGFGVSMTAQLHDAVAAVCILTHLQRAELGCPS